MRTDKMIEIFSPCKDGKKYLRGHETLNNAWQGCPRGDWMLWLAAKMRVDERLLVKAAGRCAATVKHLMRDSRSIAALEACESYGHGKIGREELADAADDAAVAAAADAAVAAAAAAAAVAAAAAAAAAVDADAAAAAAYAVTAAATAAAAADVAATDARNKKRLECAVICRELLTDAVMRKARRYCRTDTE